MIPTRQRALKPEDPPQVFPYILVTLSYLENQRNNKLYQEAPLRPNIVPLQQLHVRSNDLSISSKTFNCIIIN